MVDDDPAVGALVVVAGEVANGGPEERVPLCGRPHALVNLVTDDCVLGQPLQEFRRLERTCRSGAQ